MKRDELLALALRVEALTGPCRETDAMIRCFLFASDGAYVEQSKINGAWCVFEIGYNGKARLWEPKGLGQDQRLGSFTGSLDAAMTLVPEGFGWMGAIDPDPPHSFAATVYGLKDNDTEASANTATPALALTAAALRTIAAQGGE